MNKRCSKTVGEAKKAEGRFFNNIKYIKDKFA